jgi:hypothetical protein
VSGSTYHRRDAIAMLLLPGPLWRLKEDEGRDDMKWIARSITPLILAVLLLGSGCAPPIAPTAADRVAPQPAALSCRNIEGLDPLLVPGAVLLLGELHGTEQSPAFLANVVCLGLQAGHPVTVALEIPREERDRIETFLTSQGAESDRAAVLDSPFWGSEYQDGRRSAAMLSLLDEMRRLRREGRPLRVKLIDRMERPTERGARDRWMGEALAEAVEDAPDGVMVALTGNIHTKVGRGTPWDSQFEPAGFVLANRKPGVRLTALDVSYRDGTAWFCTTAEPSSCQVRSVRGSANAQTGRVVLHPEMTNGYHGLYEVGSLTASLPAQPR